MSDQPPTTWFHSKRYRAQAACEHCGGAVRHEAWRMTLNTEISHAYKIVIYPTALSVADALILHSLGAAWSKQGCQGNKL